MSRYIDRDAVRRAIQEYCCIQEEITPDGIAKVVMSVPTVDAVEVRHGEWVEQYEGSRLAKCSACGYEYCDLIECGNYCGNCGAKMDGERSEK